MNEDRIAGAARTVVGKAEHGLGDAVDSNRLKGDGVVDQVAGSIQHGYGKVKDTVTDVIDDAPGAIAAAVDKGRRFGRQSENVIRDQLTDCGPLYLLAGAVAVFALGVFALTSPSPAKAPKPSPRRRANSTK